MRIITTTVLALGLWLAGISAGFARELYVSNELGDDIGNGLSPTFLENGDRPVRTIRRAIALAVRGDRIIIANTGKPYRECLSLSAPYAGGVAVAPMHIEGNGATLDGSRPIPARAWVHYKGEVYRYRPMKLTYPMLFQDGRPVERVQADPVAAEPPALVPGQWCSYRGDVYFSIEVGKTIQDYELFEAGHDVGITIYRCEHLIISDLVIQGYRLDGINANEGVFNTLLLGITCRGNGRSGLFVGGASRVEVRATVLGDNGQSKESGNSAQMIAEDYSRTLLDDCELLDNTAPAMQRGQHARVEEKAQVNADPPAEKEAYKPVRAQPVAFGAINLSQDEVWPRGADRDPSPLPRPIAGNCCPKR
jgi:hypothetical protein